MVKLLIKKSLRRISKLFLLISFLASCAHTPTSWTLDTIDAGNPLFNAAKLSFCPREGNSPLTIELIRIGSEVEAFVVLTRFTFKDVSKITFLIDNETFIDEASPHLGKMRVKLSEQTTKKIIQALQSRKKVAIMMDHFEESLEAGTFSSLFEQFKRN